MSMTPEQIEEIRALLAAVTPGPWKWINGGLCLFPECGFDYGDYILFVQKSGLSTSANARLISDAPIIISELLAALEESQQRIGKLELYVKSLEFNREDTQKRVNEKLRERDTKLVEAQQTIARQQSALEVFADKYTWFVTKGGGIEWIGNVDPKDIALDALKGNKEGSNKA